MEGAVTLRTIDEDSDCREVISNRPLVVGADCPDRNQELMAARDTFPKVTDRVGIELGAAAVRQYGWPSLPATGSPQTSDALYYLKCTQEWHCNC